MVISFKETKDVEKLKDMAVGSFPRQVSPRLEEGTLGETDPVGSEPGGRMEVL